MLPGPFRLLPFLAAVVTAGCGIQPLPGTTGGAPAAPAISVDLGTVDVGSMKDLDVSIPADDRLKKALGGGATIESGHKGVRLYYSGMGPGYVRLGGYTDGIANCDGFQTSASVMQGGVEVLRLNLTAKVRRAFTIRPIEEGARYDLDLAPGAQPPIVVDHSEGLKGEVVSTGPRAAQLTIERKGEPRVPGGMLRLMDRDSRDSQVIFLPLSGVTVSSTSYGQPVDRKGEMTVAANSALTPDKPDVEVVLDPPHAYAIRTRGYLHGKLTLTLQSVTRTPTDLCVGFRRRGRWVEVQRFQVDAPP